MSDFLKTPATNVVSTIWTAGEQPTARKFNVTFNSYYQALNTVCKILGPLENDNPSFNSLGKIVSSYTYGRMSPSEQETLADDAERAIVDSFNLARIIGPHASLNPTYLPGSIHTKTEQATGWLLDSSKKVQQLPFPPYTGGNAYTQTGSLWTCGYGVEIWSGGSVSNTWRPVGTPSECLTTETDKVWHLAADGTLYSNQAFSNGDFIKYTLRVPNTFGVLGSGYNSIPDLSIFSISDELRETLYGDLSYKGALIVNYVESSASYSKWRVILPKIISAKDSLVNLDGRGLSAVGNTDAFEPFGKYVTADAPLGIPTSGKRYILNPELYPLADVNLTENVLSLYDSGRGKSYSLNLKWERTSNECVLYFYGPLSLKDQFVADDGTTLLSSNTSFTNSKDFVLFCLGTNISDTLAQTTLNYARHRHNGSDSYKISHRDLLDAENNIQGFANDQDGSNGGLDFINYNRQLAFSGVKDNPHTQYLNRLGYRFGGSQGFYSSFSSNKAVDLNAMHGDLLFYPIYNEVPASYKWLSESDYNNNVALGNTVEEITWDLNDLLTSKTDSFATRRSHAMIFGFPSQSPGNKYIQGATKLYYEPNNFSRSTHWDNTGNQWNLWRHGFIPGNFTGTFTSALSVYAGTDTDKGLNIGWGNLFFGYREDILNGRLTTGDTLTEASAFWRTSEFNVVTTGNNQAGNNTNSEIKDGYAYRDGFNVRAVKGSSIWLSAGNSQAEISDNLSFPVGNTLGKNINSNPGTISLEASYRPFLEEENGGSWGLVTLDAFKEQVSSGAGIFASPGTKTTLSSGKYENRIPWATKIPDNYKFAQLWTNDSFTTTTSDYFNILYSRGSVLDIFNLAPDINKANIDPAGSITAPATAQSNPVGTDNDLGTWPFGRPLIRGTYGIDFCASNQMDNLSTSFKTGKTLKDTSVPWGPAAAVLHVSTTNELVHREFKFWGKNSTGIDSATTVGGNINLLYNFGKSYTRFGKDLAFTAASGALNGNPNAAVSPWLNARSISLGSSDVNNYGSAIRNASYIDAFQGIRHDPLHSYTAEYVYPFRAVIDTGISASNVFQDVELATGYLNYNNAGSSTDVTDIICNKNIIIINTGVYVPPIYAGFDNTYAAINENFYSNGTTTPPTIDALIKGSEEIFLQNSVTSFKNAYPRSLVDFKINLDYFTGKRVTALESSAWKDLSIAGVDTDDASTNSPHSGAEGLTNYEYPDNDNQMRSYGRVIFGYNVMVPVSNAPVRAAGNAAPFGGGDASSNNMGVGLNRLPVVMSNRQPMPYMLEEVLQTPGGVFNYDEDYVFPWRMAPYAMNNPNIIIGYQDFLSSVKISGLSSTYKSRFPLFNSIYDADPLQYGQSSFIYDRNTLANHSDNIFVPVVNIPDFYWLRKQDLGGDDHPRGANRLNYNFNVPYRVYVGDSNKKPLYRGSNGNWYYSPADGGAQFGSAWSSGSAIANLANVKVWVELRGKIIIKVVTAAVKNPIVD